MNDRKQFSARGKKRTPDKILYYLGTPMRKKFWRSSVTTPYTSEKLVNSREYKGNALHLRNPKISEKIYKNRRFGTRLKNIVENQK
jgi:hypothetical protein